MASNKIDENLRQARALVKEKRYEEAYSLLNGINDPKAKRWLEELVQRFPHLEEVEEEDIFDMPASALFPEANFNDVTFGATDEKAKVKRSGRLAAPQNPLMLSLILPINSVLLSVNWGKLGKRNWAFVCTLISILLLIGLVALSFSLFSQWSNWAWLAYEQSWQLPTTFYTALTLVGLSLGMGFSFALAQYQPYRLIRIFPEDAHNYPYNFPLIILGIVLTTLPLVGLGHLFFGYTVWPHQVDLDEIIWHYPEGWVQEECPRPENEAVTCLAYISIHETEYNWVTATLLSYEMEDGEDIFELEADSRERFRDRHPDSFTVHTEAPLINDLYYLVIRDDVESTEQCANNFRTVYIAPQSRVYHINMVASCERLWTKYYADIDRITNGIEFR